MRLTHYYKIWPKAVSKDECERIIGVGEALSSRHSHLSSDRDGHFRDSDVAWISKLPEYRWVYDLIEGYFRTINEELWKFNVTVVQALQYTVYRPGQFYQWHPDESASPYPASNAYAGLKRKISITLQLTDGVGYDGGDFQIEVPDANPDRIDGRVKTLIDARSLGTVIAFPSFLFHRVLPVTSGIRKSLVSWYCGPPYA